MKYDIIDKKDFDELFDMVIDELFDVGDLGEDVANLIEDDSKMEDIAIETAQIVATGLELKADRSRRSIFDTQRTMEDAAKTVAGYVLSAVALADEEISEDISDRQYTKFEDLVDKLDAFEDAIEDELDDSGRDRGRGRRSKRDRGGRDRKKRGGSRRNKRSSRRDRDDDDRGSRRKSKKSSRRNRSDDDGPTRAQTQRRPRSEGIEKKEVVEEAPTSRRARAAAKEEVREESKPRRKSTQTIFAVDSEFKPTEFEAGSPLAYNPKTCAAVHTIDGDSVVSSVMKLEECTEMENYEAHELRQTKLKTTDDGTKIVPLVDFRRLPDITNKEEVEASPALITTFEKVTTVSGDALPTASAILSIRKLESKFSVGGLEHIRHLPFPVSKRNVLGSVSTLQSFEGWKRHLLEVRDEAAASQDNYECSLIMSYIHQVNRMLTVAVNDLLAIVINPTVNVDSFFDDYDDVIAFLRDEENEEAYLTWGKVEKTFLRNRLRAVPEDQLDELAKAHHLDHTEDSAVFEVGFKLYNLLMLTEGDLDSTLAFEADTPLARVSHNVLPELYDTCVKLIKFDEKNERQRPILIVDGVGRSFQIVTGGLGSPIYIRRA